MRTYPTRAVIVATALSTLLFGGTAGVATAAQQASTGNSVAVSTPHRVPTCTQLPGKWAYRWHSGYHRGPVIGLHNLSHYGYVWIPGVRVC
ncbi:hypothetical protein SAMN04487982_116215 [Streptomyces sp. ok210]|nr:hypothetical protein SAMN04487982_116215 [Streptomyces sp. ok210]